MPTPSAPTPRCSLAGTAPRWPAACFSLPPPSKRRSCLPRIRTPISTSRLPSWMPRWPTLALASVVAATAACPRGAIEPPLAAVEPEVRAGLGIHLQRVSIGGDGELFLTDDRTGTALGVV